MTGCAPCADTGAVTGTDGLMLPCPECGEHEFTELAVSEPPGQYQGFPGDTGMDVPFLDVSPLAVSHGQLTPAVFMRRRAFLPQPMPKQRADLAIAVAEPRRGKD